jgi:radical SAM superfamily enzyme YgiQ (UPF0313 family)
MKVALISPGKDDYYAKRLKSALKLPPLTLSTIAALIKPGIEVTLVDEHVEPINYDNPPDLVGITVMTSVAPRAYNIADEFRARGAKVVLGGPHPSALPEEAIQHCDAVVIGEAEGAWQRLIDDFEKGDLKQFYSNERFPSMENLPEPRRDLYKKRGLLSRKHNPDQQRLPLWMFLLLCFKLLWQYLPPQTHRRCYSGDKPHEWIIDRIHGR